MDNIPLGIQLPKINEEEIKICIALYLVKKSMKVLLATMEKQRLDLPCHLKQQIKAPPNYMK